MVLDLDGSVKFGFFLPLSSLSALPFFTAFLEAPPDFFLSILSNDVLLV